MPLNPANTPRQSDPAPPSGDAALFIDWENFKYSLYEIGQMPDVTALMLAVKERYGRPAVARAYADWQDYYHRKSFDQMSLYHAGIEPVYVPSRRNSFQQDRIKNSVDVKMSLECLEYSFTHPHVQTFVLVAGDADFLHVAGMLQRRGCRVVMVGVTGSTSQRLNAVVDEIVYYDTEIEHAESRMPLETPPGPPASAPSRATSHRPVSLEAAAETLVALVREQREQEDGINYPPVLSWLGLQMRERAPGFSLQQHGLANFKEFVSALERQGRLKIETADLVNRVWLPEDKPDRQEEPSSVRETALETPPVVLEGLSPEQTDEMTDIVLTADDIENSHRDYMARNLLVRFLHNKGHWDPSALPSRAAPLVSQSWRTLEMDDIFRRIEIALDRGILVGTTYTDPYTGIEKPALELERSHPFVQYVLAMPLLV